MIFEDSGVEGIHHLFEKIDPMMKKIGFYPAWDYHKVSYDYKLVDNGHAPDYYLRIPCKVVAGTVEHPGCEIVLETPVTFKHYYPHGMNFDADVPQDLLKKAEQLLSEVKEKLSALPELETHNQH